MMAIEFCPLELDWGNLADWAAVIVAAAGAAAVLYLTKAANETARASHQLGQQLKDREESLRAREAAVLAALLFPEVADAYAHFRRVSELLGKDEAFGWAIKTEENLSVLREWAGGPGLERLSRESGRLHVFPKALGQAIAMGLGRSYTATGAAEALGKASNKDEQERMFSNVQRNVAAATDSFLTAREMLTTEMQAKTD